VTTLSMRMNPVKNPTSGKYLTTNSSGMRQKAAGEKAARLIEPVTVPEGGQDGAGGSRRSWSKPA